MPRKNTRQKILGTEDSPGVIGVVIVCHVVAVIGLGFNDHILIACLPWRRRERGAGALIWYQVDRGLVRVVDLSEGMGVKLIFIKK